MNSGAENAALKLIMFLGDWIIAAALMGILFAAIPTTWAILKQGNSVDPLRKELEEARSTDQHQSKNESL